MVRAVRKVVRAAMAPGLSRGLLPLPHFGDCTQDGQPESQPHEAIAVAGGPQPGAADGVRPLGEAGPARVAVVDEDRGCLGVRVQRGGEAADVPPVAGRDQRAAGRSPRARPRAGPRARRRSRPRPVPAPRGETVNQTATVRSWRGGRSSGRVSITSPSGQPPPLVGDHLVGHVDLAEEQADRAGVHVRPYAEHRERRDVAGVGRPVRLLGVHQWRTSRPGRGRPPRRRRPGAGRPRRGAPGRGTTPASTVPSSRPVADSTTETGAPPVPRRSTSGRPSPVQYQPDWALAQRSGGDQRVEHGPHGVAAEQRQVGRGQRRLGRGAAQLRAEHVRVGRVQHGRLDRPAEQRLGVVDQVGVQRVVAGHQHAERLPAGPPGPPGLLPQRRQGARVAAAAPRRARPGRRRVRARWWRPGRAGRRRAGARSSARRSSRR